MTSIGRRLLGALDILSGGSISKYYMQAAVALEGMDSADEGKYRRMTSRNVRDLTPLEYSKIQKMAYYQWQRYPMASRMIEILVDFLIGEEFNVKVKIMKRVKDRSDEDTKRLDGQQVWDDFYQDPINKLESDYTTLVQDKLLNGELILPVFVNTVNGKVRIGYVDPAYVQKIETAPLNSREIDTIYLQPKDSTETITFKAIRYDDNPSSETFGKLAGNAFYFRNNYVTTQTRGHSELTNLLDWLDSFDQFLFGTVEGFNARNTFFYDLSLEGASDEAVKKMAAEATPPTQGELKVHNEKAVWTVQTPDLKAVDASAAVNLLRTAIVGSKGYPNHWFGDGSDANLATAEQMAIPTVRMIKRKQKAIKNDVKLMALFVCQKAVEAGEISLAEDEYFEVEVSMFDFEKKDSAVIGAAFTSLVNALAVATSKGWASEESAKKVVDGMLGMLGVEVDPNERPEDIKAEAEEKQAEDAMKTKRPITDYLNDKGADNGKTAGEDTQVD